MTNQLLRNLVNRECPRLAEFVSGLPSGITEILFGIIGDSQNPSVLTNRIEDILAEGNQDNLSEIVQDQQLFEVFVHTVAGSSFLSSTIRRSPHLLEHVFVNRGCFHHKNLLQKELELEPLLSPSVRPVDFDGMLRHYKEKEFLRIGARDLSGLADVTEIMSELSDLACAVIHTALEYHFGRLVLRHGSPSGLNGRRGIVALAMGKLSGGELNFSSDIDLIFLRTPEEGWTDGESKVSVGKFYESLVRSVTKSLSEVTEDGFVFRVDLRLRPEGEKGELVPSVSNALDYYLAWGRTWERAALMKAAPVAGDKDAGKEFLKELEPFIYRKHLDYSTLDDMRDMKARIESQLKLKPGVNIKLGQGGIREIEFFVQALQLINAGRTPRVRSRSTIESLNLLVESGLLEPKTANALKEAYLYFRKTEHRIQINKQLQTHELPKSKEEMEDLAFRMGYRTRPLEEFMFDLESHRRVVEELFSGLFKVTGDDPKHIASSSSRKIVDLIDDETNCVDLLEEAGFTNTLRSFNIIRKLVRPASHLAVHEKNSSLMLRLAPLFIDEILKSPDPDRTLVALDNFVSSLKAGPAYYSTFIENPATTSFLIKILGESKLFTDLLIRHPQAIDSLISKGMDGGCKSCDQLETLFFERLAYSDDFEDQLNLLRRFKNEQMLLIGVRHLTEDTKSTVVRKQISDLAEVCLNGAAEIANREMARKFGAVSSVDALPFVIIGMGKLGGQEMTYLSDLDVIFVYEAPLSQIGKLAAHDWFSRFAGRIISVLNMHTSEGIVFQIDTRLRPSGNKGALVTSLESFSEYHKNASALWEKQALIRARPVFGPDSLSQKVLNITRDCVMRTPVSRDDLREIDRLRKRMQYELAVEDSINVDLKTGEGGLVDVEFFVQANILMHSHNKPQIIRTNTLDALYQLERAQIIDYRTFEILDSGYRFLSDLEDRIRIMEEKSVDRMPLTGEKLKGLAQRLGYRSGSQETLVQQYFRVSYEIRKIYNSLFDLA